MITSTDLFVNSLEDNHLPQQDLWDKLRIKAAKRGVPIHGHFELTPQCNLNCKMCYIHLTRAQMPFQELKLDEWIRIIDEAINEGMIFASLSGGECLISPYFDDLYCHLYSKGILVTVLTNGVVLNDKLKLFQKYPPSYIQVSIYGNNEDEYENVTGFRFLKKVESAIDASISINLPIGIAITASKFLPNVANIVKKFESKKLNVSVSQWLIPPYDNTGRVIEDFNLSPSEQVKVSTDLIFNSKNLKPKPFLGKLPDVPSYQSCADTKKGITCSAGRSDFSINWKGEMSMCVALNSTTGVPLKEGFVSAWKKTNLKARNFIMPSECYVCPYNTKCNHCPAQHFSFAKTGHCNPQVCEETKLMIRAGLIEFD